MCLRPDHNSEILKTTVVEEMNSAGSKAFALDLLPETSTRYILGCVAGFVGLSTAFCFAHKRVATSIKLAHCTLAITIPRHENETTGNALARR